jgi:L-fuculose-phosphate aldolase
MQFRYEYSEKWPLIQGTAGERLRQCFIEHRDVFRYHHSVMFNRSEIASQIVLASHRVYERGYVTATDGNLSARLPNGNILVTPASLNKGQVGESDLVEVTATGTAVTLSRKASSELSMHLFIYEHRPDVKSIVHAHPPHATGFATARIPFPDALLPEVILGLGAIPLADYATPSTIEVSASLAPFVQEANAVLLSNHGVVTFGTTVEEAYFRMEKVEHAAHILFVARMLGGEKSLTGSELARLRATGGEKDPVKERIPPSDFSEQSVKQLIRQVLGEKLKNTNG